jgi:exopolyphosphatase/guanosine-5'-triphosphate,3'-diphosphate pyrophosphatase
MQALGAEKVTFTAYCLRDGILREEVRAFRRHPQGELEDPLDADLDPLLARAAALGRDERKLRRLIETSQLLFYRLRPLHRLGPQWSLYLKLAVILRNVGKAISSAQHEQHSYYIAKHIDLPVTTRWERELVAQLCLWHSTAKLPEDLGVFRSKKQADAQKAFRKLLALLQIVDALDASHTHSLNPRRVRVRPDKVSLILARGGHVELAKLRIQSKKALFEKVFARHLRAETA